MNKSSWWVEFDVRNLWWPYTIFYKIKFFFSSIISFKGQSVLKFWLFFSEDFWVESKYFLVSCRHFHKRLFIEKWCLRGISLSFSKQDVVRLSLLMFSTGIKLVILLPNLFLIAELNLKYLWCVIHHFWDKKYSYLLIII